MLLDFNEIEDYIFCPQKYKLTYINRFTRIDNNLILSDLFKDLSSKFYKKGSLNEKIIDNSLLEYKLCNNEHIFIKESFIRFFNLIIQQYSTEFVIVKNSYKIKLNRDLTINCKYDIVLKNNNIYIFFKQKCYSKGLEDYIINKLEKKLKKKIELYYLCLNENKIIKYEREITKIGNEDKKINYIISIKNKSSYKKILSNCNYCLLKEICRENEISFNIDMFTERIKYINNINDLIDITKKEFQKYDIISKIRFFGYDIEKNKFIDMETFNNAEDENQYYKLEKVYKNKKIEIYNKNLISPLISRNKCIGAIDIELAYTANSHYISKISNVLNIFSSALYNINIYNIAILDPLTETYNKKYLLQILKIKSEICNYLSIIMMDIDHFKHYNDNYGHPIGDYLLKRLTRLIKNNISKELILARYGGEEFAIILPEYDTKKAYEIAEKIRKSVEIESFSNEKYILKLTISLGISTLPLDANDHLNLIEKADMALYEAKKTGRNKVCSYWKHIKKEI